MDREDSDGDGELPCESHRPQRQGAVANSFGIGVDAFFRGRAQIINDFPEIFAASGKRSAPYRERGFTEYGDWGLVAREVAGWDHDEVQRILDWPLREVLLKYIAHLTAEAMRGYQTAMIVWATRTSMGGKQKPPELPSILREK